MKWDRVLVVRVLAACWEESVVMLSLGTRGRPVTDDAALLIRIVGVPSC